MIFSFLKTNLFFKDKVVLSNLLLGIALNIFILVWLYFKITPRVEPVALHYTIYFGIDLIGPWYHIFILPLIGAITILINFTIAYAIFLHIKILAYLSVITSTIVQILLIISSILLTLLNT